MKNITDEAVSIKIVEITDDVVVFDVMIRGQVNRYYYDSVMLSKGDSIHFYDNQEEESKSNHLVILPRFIADLEIDENA